MSLDQALQAACNSVPQCVAGGYVDMSTGMLLGVKTIDSHPSEVLDLVAAATADLFQGPTTVSVEELFRKSRGQREDGTHYFQEFLVFSDNLLHVFMRCKEYPEHAVVFICRGGVNMGMALAKARMSLAKIEKAL